MKLSLNTIFPILVALSTFQACASGKPVIQEKPKVPQESPLPIENSQPSEPLQKQESEEILTGAAQTEKYLPKLAGKRIGMVVNPTSVIGQATLVDTLLKHGVNIVKIFGPEHGFRGNASNGAAVSDEVDQATGIKVISLYGKHEAPTAADLSDIDLMVFDIQDVGVRFYTYINTLQHVMESCAQNNRELLILDRPNPNGFYIDGPVLDPRLVSGLGINPIPIVHGLTIGEYAQMLNGEGWLKNKLKCKIDIVKVDHYTHDMPYELPVKPSPNLNTQQSILLYPTLCLFEGTYISQGRGTQFPFTVLGAPALKGKYSFSFSPKSIKGMSESPLHMNQACYGVDLRNYDISNIRKDKTLNLKWLMELYKAYPAKADFFNFKLSRQMGNFDKLAGVYSLKEQIIAGKTEKEIRASWEPGLSQYKKIREKYLLYP
ncbi:exo-beta-N-acetylmuramidase NamZ family protein [Pedobacter sp. AW31-3R]|uniref:exo-beta-N-acetylmuramidase NamZ family protein n=1 Tax=Pedobacter sp. AW31-3R TaxID=3445781 RepID=UPI003F9FF161